MITGLAVGDMVFLSLNEGEQFRIDLILMRGGDNTLLFVVRLTSVSRFVLIRCSGASTRLGGRFRRLFKPVSEACLAELRLNDRDQRTLAHLRAKVARFRIGDNLAWIVECA
jgi:hypothetical protein